MSYVWDRLTKKFIKNSIDRWRMRLEKVVEEGGGLIVHLIREPLSPPSTPLTQTKYAIGSYKKFKKYKRPIVFNS